MQCWRSQGTAGCSGGQQCCQRQRLGPAKRQAAVWLPAPCRARGFLPLAAAPGSSVLWGNVGPLRDGEAQCGRASLSTAQRKGRRPAARPGDGCAAQPQRARKAAQCHQGAGSGGCWRGARWHGCDSPGKANWRAVEPLPTLPAARLFSKLFPWPRLTPALGLSCSLLSSFSPAERQSYGRAVLQGTHPCFRGPLRDPRSHNPALDTIGASISSSFPSWFNDTYSHCSCTRSLQ